MEPELLSPGAPQLGIGARPPLALAARLQAQARDDPTLLFRAIQLHQCTEKALFDLSIKFYSLFFPWKNKEGRMVLKVHF